MTIDAWKSLIIKLLLMVLTPLALQLHLSADTGVLTMIATDAADIIVLLYGVYRTYNSKNVPHDAIAISKDNVANPSQASAGGIAIIKSSGGPGEVPLARVVG